VKDDTRPVFNNGNKPDTRIVRVGTEARCDDGTYTAGDYTTRSLSFRLHDDLVVRGGKVVNEVKVTGPWRINQDVLDKSLYVTRNLSFRRHVLEEEKDKAKAMSDLLDNPECYNEKGTESLAEIMESEGVFDTAKPVGLIEYLIRASGASQGDVIMDFFAGSGTTAEAVFRMEDGPTFILIQLPELLRPNIPEQAAALAFCTKHKLPPSLCEITKYRIRKVIEINNTRLDITPNLGFKVFKLDASNIKPWDANFDNLDTALFNAVENIKPDRSEADVLYELLLKYGLDLAVPIEERQIAGKTVYIIGAGALIVCLADKISLDVVEGIAALKEELKPEVMRVVFKDSGFADDVVKTNAVQILRQAGIEDVKSL